MTSLGYLLLAAIGFVILKAFGGSSPSVPFAPGNPSSAIDPNTGAKIINTQPTNFVGPIQLQSRISATDIGAGKMWCPYPFTLYKDLADGKFYCYNESVPQQTRSNIFASQLSAPAALGDPSLILPDVIAQNPPVEQTTSYTAPTTLAPDYVQPDSAVATFPSNVSNVYFGPSPTNGTNV